MSKTIVEQSLEEEYKKTGIRPADISALRKWLNAQPHLPETYITDLDIILTYHCCYHSSEVSKQVLDLHYTLKTLFVNFFLNRSVDDNIIKTLNVVLTIPLSIPSVNNFKVVYHRLVDLDPKNFNFSDCVRAVLMILDLVQYKEGTWPGFIILIDLAGVTLGHIAKLDLLSIQQVLYFLQEAMLVKLKGLHFMNAPAYVDRLLILLKPFMKKELLDMLCIHTAGSSTVEKVVPIKALPKEIGGGYMTFEEAKNEMIEIFRANKEFFQNENRKRVVESSRPGKPKTLTDIFGGIEGSFKKLDID